MKPTRSRFNASRVSSPVAKKSKPKPAKKNKDRTAWPARHQTGGEERPRNRFLHREETKAKRNIVKDISIVIFLISLGFLLWLALFSDYTKIEYINVSQNINIPEEAVRRLAVEQMSKKRLYIFSQSNILLFSSKELRDKLLAELPLYDVDISKNLGNKLVIKLVEKGYNYIWQEGNQYYYINQEGDIIITSTSSLKDYVLISNTATPRLDGRRINIDGKYLSYAQEIDRLLKTNNHGLTERVIIFDDTINCVKLQVKSGPLIYFNTEQSVEKQLDKLDTLRRAELKDGKVFNSQKYIDLRWGDRIFYQ